MKQNYELCLVNERVTLVPYRPEHLIRYHEWMKDPELLAATGSDPLSFEEEVEMQKTWRDDPNKCTFIVHSTKDCNSSSNTSSSGNTASEQQQEKQEFSIVENLTAMVGDVNLFLSDIDEPEEDVNDDGDNGIETANTATTTVKRQAEIDIMIAEAGYKRMGLGKSATCCMLLYGSNALNVHRFFCKINEDNLASLQMFRGLGFVQCNYAACFRQIELELIKPIADLNEMLKPYGDYRIIQCAPDNSGG